MTTLSDVGAHAARALGGVSVRRSSRLGAVVARHQVLAVFLATQLGIIAIALAHNAYLFTTPLHESGDEALNGLLVARAEHGQQLVGNYSRIGFSHPGPAFLYLLAAGQALLFYALHIVPAAYNAQLVFATIFNATLIGLAVVALFRATRSASATALAATVFALAAMRFDMVGDEVWFPFLYMTPFLLLVVSGTCVAMGRTRELPSFVLALGMLVHGHICFVGIGGLSATFVFLGWLRSHRGRAGAALTAHRTAIRMSLAIGAVFLVPLVLEVVLHFPGPWPKYLSYESSGVRSRSGAVSFASWYFTDGGVPPWLLTPVAAVAVWLGVTSRRRANERVFGYLYLAAAIETLIFLAYIASSVDAYDPINYYVGFFYLTVPVIVVAATAMHFTIRIRDALLERGGGTRFVRGVAVALAAVVGVAACLTSQPRDKFLHGVDYRSLTASVSANPTRAGRTMALDYEPDMWAQVAGIAIEALRTGVPWCIVPRDAMRSLMFTPDHLCGPSGATWRVMVIGRRDGTASSAVLAREPEFVVVRPRP